MKRGPGWIYLPVLLRPQLYFLSVIPAVTGAALAFAETGRRDLPVFFLTVGGILLLQSAVVLINDYYAYIADKNSGHKLSGAAALIQKDILRTEQLPGISVMLLVLAALCALLLSMMAGPAIIVITVIGAFCGYLHRLPRFGAVKLGLGELSASINFGILPLIAAYQTQTLSMSLRPVIIAAPLALQIPVLLLLEEMRPATGLNDPRSWFNLLGYRASVYLIAALTAIWPLITAMFILLEVLPPATGICAAAILPAAAVVHICFKNHNRSLALENARIFAFLAYTLTGVLLAGGLLMAGRTAVALW